MATRPPVSDSAARRRAEAERDGLRELFAVFTHDLSNPLQSLTMLCELALDEAPNDSEQHVRAEQSVEATQRLNALVLAVSKVTRVEGPRPLGAVTERIHMLFARRFERFGVDVRLSTIEIDHVIAPPVLEVALLNFALGALVSFTSAATRQAFALCVVGSRPSPMLEPRRCLIEVWVESLGNDVRQKLEIPATHRDRLADLAAPESDLTFEYSEGVGRVSFVATES